MELLKKFKFIFILFLFVFISSQYFSNKKTMTIDWTFPYFSGAANFTNLFNWKISPNDYLVVKNLIGDSADLDLYIDYKHQKDNHLVQNTVNNYGYVLIALFSKKLFFDLGDIRGVLYLQMIVHLIMCSIILFFLKKTHHKIMFILFYAANPLIIYFVSFPFYYFWMSLVSFSYSLLLLSPKYKIQWAYILTPLILLSILIRPTTVFLGILFYLTAFCLVNGWKLKLSIIFPFLFFISSLFFIFSLSTGSAWHTMYVGIGAYPNHLGINSLSDYEGYRFFNFLTQITIDTNAVEGNWNNPIIRDLYMQTLKSRYLEILFNTPLLLIKNAILNFFQIFSIGYIVNYPKLTLLSTFVGSCTLIFLLFTRQYLWVFGIFFGAISYFLYFPPIPSYNFSSYMLLVIGLIFSFDYIYERFSIFISN